MRLDVFLTKNGFSSREKAKNAILEGLVFVDGKVIYKPSFLVYDDDKVEVLAVENFVSRGALKIKKAFEEFSFSFNNKTVMDIGASTGGFTQYALMQGAKKVYAVDVGSGVLAESLRTNDKVVNIENQDFRYITKGKYNDVNLIIGDVSFISLRHILPKIKELYTSRIEVVILFKPQFECGPEIAKKFKGVVTDKKIHKRLLRDFVEYVKGLGFIVSDIVGSSIRGKEGNIEYLFHLNGANVKKLKIDTIIDEAFKIDKMRT